MGLYIIGIMYQCIKDEVLQFQKVQYSKTPESQNVQAFKFCFQKQN